MQINIESIENIVDKYGNVLALRKEKTSALLAHDYIFFCITKGARSLKVLDLILTEGFTEDSKIIMRAVYECYLNASFVYNNPNRINELLASKIGVYMGVYKHPKSKKGNLLKHKLIHPETKEIVNYGVSINEMAINTCNEWDAKSHTNFYSFLSEFVHVHMIASGAYRTDNDEWYTVNSGPNSIYSTVVLATYTSWLLFDIAIRYITEIEVEDDFDELKISGEIIIDVLKKIEFDKKLMPLQEQLINRIKST